MLEVQRNILKVWLESAQNSPSYNVFGAKIVPQLHSEKFSIFLKTPIFFYFFQTLGSRVIFSIYFQYTKIGIWTFLIPKSGTFIILGA